MKNLLFGLVISALFAACTPPYDATSVIEMKKGACFGTCPVYTFKVDGTGNATFSGERHVQKEGNWKRTLTPKETDTLFKAFEGGNFFAFENEYTAEVTDLPTTYISFSHKGNSKTIKDYYGAPEALKNLEKQVETIAEANEGWVKVE